MASYLLEGVQNNGWSDGRKLIKDITGQSYSGSHLTPTSWIHTLISLLNSWSRHRELRVGCVCTHAYIKRTQTVSTLLTFFLAMANHHEAQEKAQAELDAVVGQDHLPEYSDRVNLPYIDAIITELMRWKPVQPLGPHYLSQGRIQAYVDCDRQG